MLGFILGCKSFLFQNLHTQGRSSVAFLSFPLFGFFLHLSLSPGVSPLDHRTMTGWTGHGNTKL